MHLHIMLINYHTVSKLAVACRVACDLLKQIRDSINLLVIICSVVADVNYEYVDKVT